MYAHQAWYLCHLRTPSTPAHIPPIQVALSRIGGITQYIASAWEPPHTIETTSRILRTYQIDHDLTFYHTSPPLLLFGKFLMERCAALALAECQGCTSLHEKFTFLCPFVQPTNCPLAQYQIPSLGVEL